MSSSPKPKSDDPRQGPFPDVDPFRLEYRTFWKELPYDLIHMAFEYLTEDEDREKLFIIAECANKTFQRCATRQIIRIFASNDWYIFTDECAWNRWRISNEYPVDDTSEPNVILERDDIGRLRILLEGWTFGAMNESLPPARTVKNEVIESHSYTISFPVNSFLKNGLHCIAQAISYKANKCFDALRESLPRSGDILRLRPYIRPEGINMLAHAVDEFNVYAFECLLDVYKDLNQGARTKVFPLPPIHAHAVYVLFARFPFATINRAVSYGVNARYACRYVTEDTAWHAALQNPEWERILDLLANVCIDRINVRDVVGATPLAHALRHDSPNMAFKLIELGTDLLSYRDWDGCNYLHYLVMHPPIDLELLKLLLERGVPKEAGNNSTPGSPIHALLNTLWVQLEYRNPHLFRVGKTGIQNVRYRRFNVAERKRIANARDACKVLLEHDMDQHPSKRDLHLSMKNSQGQTVLSDQRFLEFRSIRSLLKHRPLKKYADILRPRPPRVRRRSGSGMG